MNKHYRNAFSAWSHFENEVQGLIHNHQLHTVGEIGGGANPILQPAFIQEHQLLYDILDISTAEMDKADTYYSKKQVDFQSGNLDIAIKYDLLFAQMTLEHISDPAMFYHNVGRMLTPGGYAFFFFACDTMLPTRVNKMLPEFVSDRILKKLQPFRKQAHQGKFKAHYRWCKGPTRKNIKRLTGTGLQVVAYTGFFGHSYYHRLPLLQKIENWKTKLLLKRPLPQLCSYSQVLLQKPLSM